MASNEGSPQAVKNPSPEKRKGISRKKKSASQTEVLEKTYVVEKYPSESTRTRLCRDLDLTEKQLQIWFTHRRYKDRRDGIEDEELSSKARGGSKVHEAASRKRGEIDLNSREAEDHSNHNNVTTAFEDHGHPSRVLAEEHNDEEFMAEDEDEEEDEEDEVKVKVKVKVRPGRRPKMVDAMERAAIAAIERQLGGPFRDDGPPLGFEFDPLPPDAFQQPTWIEGGYREGESEISDRDGREGNGEFQWRNEAKSRVG